MKIKAAGRSLTLLPAAFLFGIKKMSLSSASTRAEALAQYNDNLDWQGSGTKARLALEAVRWLLINRPQNISENSRSLSYESLLDEKRRLEEFVALNSSAVNRAPFTQGRMLT